MGEPGAIILLNGASSSGKSTIASGLQEAASLPFWHISIDHLIQAKVLPSQRISTGEFSWRELRPSFFKGFHQCLPALATAGNNLIVEHIVESEDWMERLLKLLAPFDVFFVGIHCPLEELERREIARGDRRIGDAKKDFETTHKFCKYDIEVSSINNLEDNVSLILAGWQNRSKPAAFDLMRSQRAQGIN